MAADKAAGNSETESGKKADADAEQGRNRYFPAYERSEAMVYIYFGSNRVLCEIARSNRSPCNAACHAYQYFGKRRSA